MFCRGEPRALRALFQTHIEQSIRKSLGAGKGNGDHERHERHEKESVPFLRILRFQRVVRLHQWDMNVVKDKHRSLFYPFLFSVSRQPLCPRSDYLPAGIDFAVQHTPDFNDMLRLDDRVEN